MIKKLTPDEFTKLVRPQGYEGPLDLPASLNGRQGRAYGWYHTIRETDLIVIKLVEDGFLDQDSVEDCLARLGS